MNTPGILYAVFTAKVRAVFNEINVLIESKSFR